MPTLYITAEQGPAHAVLRNFSHKTLVYDALLSIWWKILNHQLLQARSIHLTGQNRLCLIRRLQQFLKKSLHECKPEVANANHIFTCPESLSHVCLQGRPDMKPFNGCPWHFLNKSALSPVWGKTIESNYVVKSYAFPHALPFAGGLVEQPCKGNVDSTRWSLFTRHVLYILSGSLWSVTWLK